MGNIGDPISETLPTVGVTAGPQYATDLNAWAAEVERRLEAQVPAASLNINADLSCGNNELSNVGAVGLQNRGSNPSGTNKLFIVGGEFYVLDGAGRAVQITSGGNLNAAAVEGIGGDYGGADPALLSYDAANSVFVFTQDPGVAADLDAGDVKIRQKSGSKFSVTIKPSASLGANINRTLLAANPASTSLLAVSSAGAESATRDPSVDSVTASGAIQGATVTGSTSVTTGGADVLHGNRVRMIGASAMVPEAGWAVDSAADTRADASGAANKLRVPITLEQGQRFKAVSIICLAATASDITVKLYKTTGTIGAGSATTAQVGTTQTNTATANIQAVTVDPADVTINATDTLFVEITAAANGNTKRVIRAEVTYDRP